MLPEEIERHERKRKRRSNAIRFSLLGIAIVVVLTAYLLLNNPQNSVAVVAFINIYAIVIMALLAVITRNLVKLYLERSRRFRSKLVMAFVATAFVPVIILSVIGYGIVNESMRQWFNPRLDVILEGSKALADLFVEEERARLAGAAELIVEDMSQGGVRLDGPKSAVAQYLREQLKTLQLDVLQIYLNDESEWVRAMSAEVNPPGVLLKPPKRLLAGVRSKGGSTHDIVEHRNESTLVLVAPLLADASQPYSEENRLGYLVLHRLFPENIYSRVASISNARATYISTTYNRGQFGLIYAGIFVLIGVSLIYLGLWFGSILAKEIAHPVQELSNATEAVAKGDLDVQVNLTADAEFKTLMTSFNTMTEQLREQRDAIQGAQQELIRKNMQLAEKQNYIETLLQHIPNGVISLDPDGYITTFNTEAGGLLKIDPKEAVGRPAESVFQGQPVDRLYFWMRQMKDTRQVTLKRQMTLNGEEEHLYLDVSCISFQEPITGTQGYLIVLEDLSELLKAQRAAAWQEVARRIAHEIKNPLTPISLSAQRLQRRCRSGRPIEESFAGESLKTIMEGINEIQGLVNEFSRFARMPQSDPSPNDLHEVIRSTVELYTGPYPEICFDLKLAEHMPEVSLDPEQMRRALRNVIDNGIAAMGEAGSIGIATEHDPLFQIARVTISDEGTGIKPGDREKLFMPYFTTKGEKGTGLGLAIVSKIVSDHNGYIRIKDNKPQGTKVVIELPTGYSVATSWRQ